MKCINCDNDMRYVTKSVRPIWATICAIILLPFTFGLSLLFLTAREEKNYFICDKCGYKRQD